MYVVALIESLLLFCDYVELYIGFYLNDFWVVTDLQGIS